MLLCHVLAPRRRLVLETSALAVAADTMLGRVTRESDHQKLDCVKFMQLLLFVGRRISNQPTN